MRADSSVLLKTCGDLLTVDALATFLQTQDAASYYALRALRAMHGEAIRPYTSDVFRFLNHRGIPNAFDQYVRRIEGLRNLQAEFDKTGKYAARTSREVIPIDDEQYKLALLLSFISTNHRFEILQSLVKFLRTPCAAPQEVLSIGYGTGYEIKLAFDEMPGWKPLAFDNSPESHHYASGLLGFFGYPTACLRRELFPIPLSENTAMYRQRFGKVILCELLEHLDDPGLVLETVRAVLAPGGLLFCTMAVNIAQEDHVYLYTSAEQARSQVLERGYRIIEETLAPVVIMPFPESRRPQMFNKGNYICVASPS
jgi:SAM-dependent methyltransferase